MDNHSQCDIFINYCLKKDIDNMKKLLAEGVDINCRDKRENTPLIAVCAFGSVDIVEFLLENGAYASLQNEYGDTALMNACLYNKINIVEFLLEHGAFPDTQNNNEQTALIIASSKGNIEIVKLLLDHDADIYKRDIFGFTALSLTKSTEIKQLIKDAIKKRVEDDKRLMEYLIKKQKEHVAEIAVKELEDEEKLKIEKEEERRRKKEQKLKTKREEEKIKLEKENIEISEASKFEKEEPIKLEEDKSKSEIIPKKYKEIIYDPEIEKKLLQTREENIKERIKLIIKNNDKYEENLKNIDNIEENLKEHHDNLSLIKNNMIDTINTSYKTLNDTINLKEYQKNFNSLIINIKNARKQLADLQAKNNYIENTYGNSYFYIGKPIIKNCDSLESNCGILQLQLDFSPENTGEKIKIHGIFPDTNTTLDKTIITKVDFENQNTKVYEKIYDRNFKSFFDDSIELFTQSVEKKHNIHSFQNIETFISNTIFLSEAIMLKLQTSKEQNIAWYLKKIENLNPIWGFSHFVKDSNDKYKIYFKVCFNNTHNLWQLCKSNYKYKSSVLDGLRRRTKSSKLKRRKTIRKSIKLKRSRRRTKSSKLKRSRRKYK